MLGLSNQQSKPQHFYNAFKLLKCNKVNAPNSHICKSTRSSSMKSVYTWQLSPPCYDLLKSEHSSQNVEVCGLLLFCELWMNRFMFTSSGGAGAVDTERRPDPGEQRPELPAAEDSFWTDPLLPHPADLPLHLREQKDGHHRQGVELVYNNMMCGCCFLCDVFVIQSCSFRVSVSVYYIIECRRLESLSDFSFM